MSKSVKFLTLKSRNEVVFRIAVHCCAIALAIFSLLPILWIISTSLKLPSEVYAIPPRWIPRSPVITNYIEVLANRRILHYFANSTIIAGFSTVIALILATFGAYGFARFKFIGKESLAIIILFNQMLPLIIVIIPFYIMLQRLHLLGTYRGIILVYLVITLPVSVWLLRGFFQNIPKELEEASFIDGCSRFTALWRVILPIAFPAVIAVGLYSFTMAWNEFTLALILTDQGTRTIPVGLAYFQQEFLTDWGGMMATSAVFTLPVLLLFIYFRKKLISSMVEGAIKG